MLFRSWEFLSKPLGSLSPDEQEEMTRRAYAAAYHWDRAEGSTVANAARAEWLLARVWVVRGNGALALFHADRCMRACERGSLVDFALAAVTRVCGFTPEAGEALMAVGRLAGWLAHAMEEYGEAPLRFRPRASYIGV